MTGNVIDSRDRFRSNTPTAQKATAPSDEERLLAVSRLTPSDKATFAINLGKLAAKIDAADPLSGARRICAESGLDGIWDKRKRYFRLPGEEAPTSSRDGEYGSRPGTFINLAKAAGQLIAGSNREVIVQAERGRAVRALILGTTFAPTFEPSDSGDRTAKSLLDHYASAVCAAAERTRIRELWDTLRGAPFSIEAFDEEERNQAPPSQYGEAAEVPTLLLRPYFRDHVVAARFDTQQGWVGTDWANPTIAIGLIAIRTSTRMFAIPSAIQPHFSMQEDDDEGTASPIARAWLESIGFKHGQFPEIEYSASEGFGWRPCEVSSMRWVGLEIFEGEDGRVELKLIMWGGHRVACAWSHLSSTGHEKAIAASAGRLSQARYIELEDGLLVDAICASPFDIGVEAMHPPVVGLMPSEVEDYEVYGWTESAEVFDLLTGSSHPFYPTVPQAEPLNGPIIGNAVGAALLENARSASSENSIARQLVERASLTADAGLRFHEAMVDTYREAFRRI